MANRPGNIKSARWVAFTALGFVLFLGLAIVLGIYSSRLSSISTPVYFFLLVAIGLVAAGFLFGALRSHARYSGKVYNGTLELSGPVVVMVAVILLGYKFRPSDRSFSTTVNLFSADSAHTPISEGQLTAYYGAAQSVKKIANGQVVFSEMPKEFAGREVTFVPVVEGYVSKLQKVTLPADNGVVSLYLEKIPEAVTVSGIVLAKGGKTAKNAVVVFADGLVTDTTDRFGNFKVTLPFKDGTETTVRVYQDEELKYNNLALLSGAGPLTIQLD